MPHRLTTLPCPARPLAPLGPLARGLAAEWDDGLAVCSARSRPIPVPPRRSELLAAATPERLAELAADAGYVEAIAAAVAARARSASAPKPGMRSVPEDRPRRSPTSRPSSASARRCRSTPAASASSPATT